MTAAPEPDLSPSPAWPAELRGLRQRLHDDFPELQAAVIDHCLSVESLRFEGSRITAFVPILVDKNVRARLREMRQAG